MLEAVASDALSLLGDAEADAAFEDAALDEAAFAVDAAGLGAGFGAGLAAISGGGSPAPVSSSEVTPLSRSRMTFKGRK
jgi:hypothetical protein